jgi:hypothetical protein
MPRTFLRLQLVPSFRRKRILDNTEPAAKVAKTCDSRPYNMRLVLLNTQQVSV